jgi:hypothetical protein
MSSGWYQAATPPAAITFWSVSGASGRDSRELESVVLVNGWTRFRVGEEVPWVSLYTSVAGDWAI